MVTSSHLSVSRRVQEINTGTTPQSDVPISARREHSLTTPPGIVFSSVRPGITERPSTTRARRHARLAITPSIGPEFARLIAWRSGTGTPITPRQSVCGTAPSSLICSRTQTLASVTISVREPDSPTTIPASV